MTVIYLAIWATVIGGTLIALIHLSDKKTGHKIKLVIEDKDNDNE
tara:strand:- start:655 stop:789 length:135 start_codon:yes stop_codon:yes gene_type:complete